MTHTGSVLVDGTLTVAPGGPVRPVDCRVPASCVNWPCPDTTVCDPCIDPNNPDHLSLFDRAWKSVASFLYVQTGSCWPGVCYEEIARPCVREHCRCSGYRGCGTCGVYEYLPVESATCLPIVDLVGVWIGPTPCNGQTETVLRPGDGVRLEFFYNEPRIVLEDPSGCCGTWPTQDMCSPTGGEGSWHVVFHTGLMPPQFVLDGAVEMANDIVKSCVVNGCKFPGNITSQSFDGTSVTVDPDVGVSLNLRMLQQLLDRVESERGLGVVEQYGRASDTEWHRVSGPVPVDCDAQAGC